MYLLELMKYIYNKLEKEIFLFRILARISKLPVQPSDNSKTTRLTHSGIRYSHHSRTGSDPGSPRKKEYIGSALDRGYNRIIMLQEYTHFGNNIKIFIELYSTKTVFIKYVDILAVFRVVNAEEYL